MDLFYFESKLVWLLTKFHFCTCIFAFVVTSFGIISPPSPLPVLFTLTLSGYSWIHWHLYSTDFADIYVDVGNLSTDMSSVNGLGQRFTNWGPRTKGGPRRVATGSARGFRKVVIVCTVFNNLRPICFHICTHKSVTQSQCIAWKCCRGLARQAFCWCLLVVLRVICWLLWWLVHPFCGRWCCG